MKTTMQDDDNYFKLIAELRAIGIVDGYNIKFFNLVINEIELIKRVNKKAIKALKIKSGDAIFYNGKNYIVKETYIGVDEFSNKHYQSGLVTNCGLNLNKNEIKKAKVLK